MKNYLEAAVFSECATNQRPVTIVAVALIYLTLASCGGGIPTGSPGTKSAKPPALNKPPAFPWPPPAASAEEIVPLSAYHAFLHTLADVDFVLSNAFRTNGYVEKSYYAVPGGFALVTRLEQINIDGTSKRLPSRWSTAPPTPEFSLAYYLSALFTAIPGYYRVIVFVVSNEPFIQTERRAGPEEALRWLRAGLNVLPESIGSQSYANAVCTALIYEFERPPGGEPTLHLPGKLGAQTHLKKSGLWSSLSNPATP